MTSCPVQVVGRRVVVDLCDGGCGGIWVDASDFRSGLKASVDLAGVTSTMPLAVMVPRNQPVICPVCHEQMDRFRWDYHSPVTLDHCSYGHGTWFDGGEPAAMAEWESQQCLAEPLRADLRLALEQARQEGERALQPKPGELRTVIAALLSRM